MSEERRGAGRPKSRPRRVAIPEIMPAALDRIPVAKAVVILASRLPKEGGATTRTTEDKVRHRIRDAIRAGSFSAQDGKVTFGAVIGWARGIADWTDALVGLPAIQSAASALNAGAAVTINPTVKYATEGASDRLADAMTQIERLESQSRADKAEVDALRPDAEAYRAQRERNRQSGKRSRKQ